MSTKKQIRKEKKKKKKNKHSKPGSGKMAQWIKTLGTKAGRQPEFEPMESHGRM